MKILKIGNMTNDEEKKIFEEGGITITNKRVVWMDKQVWFGDGYSDMPWLEDRRVSIVKKTKFSLILSIIIGIYSPIALLITIVSRDSLVIMAVVLICFVLSSIYTVYYRYYKNNFYSVSMDVRFYQNHPGDILVTKDKFLAEKVANTIRKAIVDRREFITNQEAFSLKAEMFQLNG